AGVVSLLALPAATVVALLRHRLYDLDAYDLDTLVDRSLLYAGLGVVLALAYWGVVSLLGGGLLEEVFSVKPGLATSLVAAGVVAAAWRPLRKLLELGLDRLRYDKLAAEALARLGHRLEATLTPEEVLPAIVETIASALRVPYVAVEVTSGERVIAAAAHGEPGTADVVVKLVHQAEEIGRLLVGTRSPQEPLSDGHRRLLDELASQAGVAASVVRLTAELQRSRARVVAAADAERRRIERNIHDGAQQHLVALAVNLRLVRDLGMDDPEQAGAMLDQLAKDVRDTLQELRDLAHGIYPPLLVDSGLEQALRAAVNRSPLDAEVDTAGIERYPAEVEAAVYFCCLEALQNAAKHAGPGASVTIRVAEEEGMLVFTVADDGVGFDPAVVVWNDGFTNMSDRLGAIGGALHLDSEPGHGTRVSGTIPLP
ncbi:MAG: histidine kinase, partial [Actinomycetota bacterium]|nr:histidine kinase [Actinomycetota bacterium]